MTSSDATEQANDMDAGESSSDDNRLRSDLKEIRRKLGKLRRVGQASRLSRRPDKRRPDNPVGHEQASRLSQEAPHREASGSPREASGVGRRLDSPPPIHIGDLRRARVGQASRLSRRPDKRRPDNPVGHEQASRLSQGHQTATAVPPITLEDAVDGVEVTAADGSPTYLITRCIADDADEWRELRDAFRVGQASRLSNLQPEDLIFLDLETTGLESTPLFLIGAMTWEDDAFVVRQYFARHYGEERATISLFLDSAAEKNLLVSFNGKSYDWPYVRMRAMATGVPFDLDLPHLDLLHESRRAWKDILPDCKLQTLEQHICGRGAREGDIPGGEIPDAYHDFVRTGNAAQMVTVLEHNFLDLVTLADLLVRLP